MEERVPDNGSTLAVVSPNALPLGEHRVTVGGWGTSSMGPYQVWHVVGQGACLVPLGVLRAVLPAGVQLYDGNRVQMTVVARTSATGAPLRTFSNVRVF